MCIIFQILQKVLKDPRYGNYNILSQGGLSSSFSRPLSQDKSANSSFSNMLEIQSGLLKRSTVDVFVDVHDTRMRLLSVSIFSCITIECGNVVDYIYFGFHHPLLIGKASIDG